MRKQKLKIITDHLLQIIYVFRFSSRAFCSVQFSMHLLPQFDDNRSRSKQKNLLVSRASFCVTSNATHLADAEALTT